MWQNGRQINFSSRNFNVEWISFTKNVREIRENKRFCSTFSTSFIIQEKYIKLGNKKTTEENDNKINKQNKNKYMLEINFSKNIKYYSNNDQASIYLPITRFESTYISSLRNITCGREIGWFDR